MTFGLSLFSDAGDAFSDEEVEAGSGDGVILSLLLSDLSILSFALSDGVEHLLVLTNVGCVGELFVEALLLPSLLKWLYFVRTSMLTLQEEKCDCRAWCLRWSC